MVDFRGISLQATLIEEVEELIKNIPYYRSVAEFVSEAVRLRIEQLRKQGTQQSTASATSERKEVSKG